LKTRTASEPKNFKLMHAAILKCLSFNVPYVIAASKSKLKNAASKLKKNYFVILL
jgi:hypothetical protein